MDQLEYPKGVHHRAHRRHWPYRARAAVGLELPAQAVGAIDGAAKASKGAS